MTTPCNKYEVREVCKPLLDISSPEACTSATSLQEEYVAQALDISGAPVNFYKLLGVHEQQNDVDVVGSGWPIASGTDASGNVLGPFNSTVGLPWISALQGAAVSLSWVGYSFGIRRTPTGAPRSMPADPAKMHITRIKIRQSAVATERVIQAKIQSSNDGLTWKNVDVVNFPDSALLETVHIRQSAPAQQWRICPLMFMGGAADAWKVHELKLQENAQTTLANVQDLFLLENRDRSYATESVMVKCQVTPQEVNVDLSRFGIELSEQYEFEASFLRIVEALGRPVVVGDIVEIPFDVQYDRDLRKMKSYMEVTDVDWSSTGYSTSWTPVMLKFWAKPAMSTQETADVLGLPSNFQDILGTAGQDFCDTFGVSLMPTVANDAAVAEAEENLPKTGVDSTEIMSGGGEPATMFGQYDGNASIYVEDGLPPDGKPYTEGDTFPPAPADRAFHRLTYPNTHINTRLFVFSSAKNRWIFLEEDKRKTPSSHRPTVKSLMGGIALSKARH